MRYDFYLIWGISWLANSLSTPVQVCVSDLQIRVSFITILLISLLDPLCVRCTCDTMIWLYARIVGFWLLHVCLHVMFGMMTIPVSCCESTCQFRWCEYQCCDMSLHVRLDDANIGVVPWVYRFIWVMTISVLCREPTCKRDDDESPHARYDIYIVVTMIYVIFKRTH